LTEDVKQRWMKDLRSGEFQQGFGQLYNHSYRSYCCLGVLCKDNLAKYHAGCNLEDYVQLREDYELKSEEVNRLVSMNDSKKKTFPEIADWIDLNITTTPNFWRGGTP
jgi:hypothetical protein